MTVLVVVGTVLLLPVFWLALAYAVDRWALPVEDEEGGI